MSQASLRVGVRQAMPRRSTLIVAATGAVFGLILGGLASTHAAWAAPVVVALVLVAMAVFVRELGWNVGLVVLLIVASLLDHYTFPVGRLNVRAEQIAVLVAVAVTVVKRRREQRGLSLQPSMPETVVLVWFALGLFSTLVAAPDRLLSLKVLALLVVSALAMFVPRRLLEHRTEEIEQVVRWLLLAFAFESAYALLAYFLHLFGLTISMGFNAAAGHLDAYGTLWEPNVLGAFCGAAALAWVFLGGRFFRHAWIGIAMCLSATVVSFARAAWLAVILVLVLSLVSPLRKRIDLRTLLTSAAATLVVIAAVLAADKAGNYSSRGSLVTALGNDADVYGRLYQIKPVFADLDGKLVLTGGGINSFPERHVLLGIPQHLANLELTILNDTGLLGVLLLATFAVAIVVAVWRSRDNATVLGLGVMMLVLVITNSATETLELMITWLLIGLLLAAIDGAADVKIGETVHTVRRSGQ